MKIVVLDGYTLNPGDLSWAPLEAMGSVTVYDRTPEDKTIERIGDAEIVLTNKVRITRKVLISCPNIKYIGVLATGYNVIDVEACREKGIVVTNVPAYSTPSVAQLAFALLLELTHHVGQHSDGVRAGKWSRCVDFCYWETPLIELAGKTMGVIGAGRIGSEVLRIATAFGMETQFHDPLASGGIGLEDLLRTSDVVSLHCPLTESNAGLINKNTLALMKPSAFLLNTSRGPLIVDRDLADALNAEKIAGAGIDVLSVEPPSPDNPLLSAKNCVITPHIAWASFAARQRLMETAVSNVSRFLAGAPQNAIT